MAQSKPVHEVRLGKVKGAIWLNESESGPRYSVTFARIYKTDESWESSNSFGRDELLMLGKVADMAHTWIFSQVEGASDSVRRESDSNQRGSGNDAGNSNRRSKQHTAR